MELYTLDSQLRRTEVIDDFESCVWTDRFQAMGDFQLEIASTPEHRALFAVDGFLAMNNSRRVMKIETVENKTDTNGKILSVSGRDLVSILDDRVGKNSLAGLTAEPKWIITGLPAAILRQMFTEIMISGDLAASDILPFYSAGSTYPTSTIAEPSGSITAEMGLDTLYNLTKELAVTYDLGFRLYRNADLSQLKYDIYAGSDRTTAQTTYPAVVFSPELDNLANISELTSNALFKNVAYVFSKNGSRIVYAAGATSSTAGLDRRVMYVTVESELAAGAPLQTLLEQKGLEALAQNRSLSAFDGEIRQNSSYKYEIDYFLGDLVEMRNSDGVTNQMRVTENIQVQDAEGERSYPTLAINLFITPGSWYAWNFNQVWNDVPDDASNEWADF